MTTAAMPLCFTDKTLVVGVVTDVATWSALPQSAQLCDIVELRADALPDIAAELMQSSPCPRPVLLTLRHADEGGLHALPEPERVRLAADLLPYAAALDWEIAHLDSARELVARAKAMGVAVVASAHYFQGMPTLEEMLHLKARAVAAGADVVKIAFTPSSPEEVQRGVEFLRLCGDQPTAVMGMGTLGPTSRALYARSGSALIYGYLGDTPAAPGQMSAAQCRELCSR